MGDLVTVEMLREHVSTSLGDDALERYIAAAEQAILAKLGPLGNVTEMRFLRGERIVLLGRIPSTVISVTELYDDDVTTQVLDATDYVLDRGTFRRLDTGAHPPTYWRSRMTFVYTPEDDEARRILAVIALCALDIRSIDSAAVTSRTVGQHKVDFSSPTEREDARAAIWAELEAAQTPLFA